MPSGLTRKFDYEKGKRQANAQKQDYRERFQDEGKLPNRGGKKTPRLFKFHGNAIHFDMRSIYSENKHSLIHTLGTSTNFVVQDRTGTIGQLRKIPSLADTIDERFELIRRSIMQAREVIGIASHPKTGHDLPVVEFKSCLKPAEPFPDPIFKRDLAFSIKLVGPALTGQ